MPTIDELAPVIAAADTDELPTFQSGECRKVTRAQLLAGMQVQMTVPPGSLLGRTSLGTGAPETITVGRNLSLSGGMLSAPAPFATATLPPARTPAVTDMVPIGQAGVDAAIPYGPFLGGLSSLSGIDLSQHVVRPSGTPVARTLGDSFSDLVAVEAYGAVGDGITDCTDAINVALSSGRRLLFGPHIYLLRGQCTISASVELIGVVGRTVLRRPTNAAQDGGAWVSIQGQSFTARGIVFDANHHPLETWAVLVTAGCQRAIFSECGFCNATGNTLGTGLAVLPNPGLVGHVFSQCEFNNNSVHGLWVRSTTGARVIGCVAHDNAAYGICLDDDDPALSRQVKNALVTGNTCWNNGRGISVGNFNQTNTQPAVWGNASPDVVGVVVTNNACFDNSAYGVALAGQSLLASGNLLLRNGGAGILFNALQSRIENNMIVASPGSFGVDAGGCTDCDILSNNVSGGGVGINVGGTQRVRCTDNRIDNSVWGFAVYNVETDGHGNNFGQGTNALTIRNNRITFGSSNGGGITLLDAPQTVLIADNEFFGTGPADISQCLYAHTDSVMVRGNTWNNQARIIVNPSSVGAIQQIMVPDILDDVMVTAAPGGVQSIQTRHAVDTTGTVTFIRVTNGGTGYSTATVSILGRGSGATAIAYLRNGSVVGVCLTAGGSGYDGSTTVSITGNGQGAIAIISVGLAPQEDRRLRIHCNAVTRFDRAAGTPPLDNWTMANLTVPAGSTVDWTVSWGSWRATGFALGEFLAPPGDGSLVLRTLPGGDLVLRPATTGAIRFGSDAAASGCTLSIGHGSPDGVVAAPPGSDYRNLDGGAGTTLWIKRSGTDAHGWSAIG